MTGATAAGRASGAALLSGEWRLFRTALREPGSRTHEPLHVAEQIGTVTVPGNIQLQLGFTDPWLDVPELEAINNHEWLYVRDFVSPPLERGERLFIVFDGVDYFADVWVNGHHVGHHEGGFTTFEFDLSELTLPPGERNELVVAVSCPWRVDSREFYLQPSTVFSPNMRNSEYMKGNLLHYWDGLPFSGHAVFPFGLWRDVHLVSRRGCVLVRAAMGTVGLVDDHAQLELALEWWSGEASSQDVGVSIEISPANFAGEIQRCEAALTVEPGRSDHTVHLALERPALWWTWDTGPQHLYTVTVRSIDGRELGSSRFGVRTLERDERTLAYSLNGRRLFLRGVWYPFANIFAAAPTTREHQRDAEMLREANINHIVAFTVVEKEAFYRACDEQGILVFQELPFPQLGPMRVLDPAYPRFQDYWETALAAVENVVRQLRGHASVALWASFAETRKQGRWLYGDYTDFSEAVRAIVGRLDIDGLYHPSFCDFEEEHIWDGGFPDGEFWDHYARNYRFISEFGAIAPPVVETLREILGPDAIWGREERRSGRVGLPIDVEEYSYRWSFDYPGLCNSVARLLRWVDRSVPTLERFVDGIQYYQALGLRYAAEAYRRKRFSDIAGCRTWSYRENVPGIKFTVVDHRQRPKMGYFGLQQAYAPLLLSLDEQYPLAVRGAGSTYERELFVVNDTDTPETLEIETTLRAPDGSGAVHSRAAANVGADALVTVALELPLPARAGPYLLRSVARAPDGSERARSEWWIRTVAPVFAQPIRVLLLGQHRYNEPILESFRHVPGVGLEVVDETSRHPQDSSWSEDLDGRVDVVWFAGWDSAAHLFRPSEWANIAAAVGRGIGFIHTGGQGCFHGGDGRGAMLDATALGAVLPVSLRPHDGIWDYVPEIDPGDALTTLGISLGGYAPPLFHRTRARPGARVHATIDGRYPLIATGTHGAGPTAVFAAGLVRPLRKFGVEFRDPLEVEPPWSRSDIRAYSPFWSGTLQLGLGLLAHVSGRTLAAPPGELAEQLTAPIFEILAGLPQTRLEVRLLRSSVEGGELVGAVEVRNAGDVVARLVRGEFETTAGLDHRVRDGFVDLLPGERTVLRFEADGWLPGDRLAVSAQNAERAVTVVC